VVTGKIQHLASWRGVSIYAIHGSQTQGHLADQFGVLLRKKIGAKNSNLQLKQPMFVIE